MRYTQATGKTIQESFEQFHRDNPQVYVEFKAFLRELYRAGIRKTSAKLIINRVRWERQIQTKSNDEFRINDAFSSRYARLFCEEYPAYASMFNQRELRSK